MFSDLDDPRVFEPGPDLLARVKAQGRVARRRRTMWRTLGGVSGALILVVASLGLYAARRDAAIDRVELTTAPSTDGAVNVLLLGTGGPSNPPAADSITVLRLRPNGSVGLLSLPRDLRDPGPDGTGATRLGWAVKDGLQGMVDAVVRSTGIPIDHVVQLDFAGFIGLVDELGGLDIGVDARLRDLHVGLDLGPTPCTNLDGEHTLGLLRSRWTETLGADGRWVPDPTGDLGRIGRAQVVARAVLTKLVSGDRGPAELDRISRLLADHATLDAGLSLRELVDLGRRLAAAGPDRTTADLLPVHVFQAPDGASLLDMSGVPIVLADYGSQRSGDPTDASTSSGDGRTYSVAQLHPCSP
jgi:LCP family protein required for cell wall assembly